MTTSGTDAETRATDLWERWRERLKAPITIDGILLGTAFTLLALIAVPPAGLHIVVRIVLAVGLVAPLLVRGSRVYWLLVLALFLTSPLGRSWLDLDNHEYLQVYWLVAIAGSRFATRPDDVLRVAARWLVGVVFAFAVVWKLLGPGFVEGAAMEFLAVTDPRLVEMFEAGGVQPSGSGSTNREALDAWNDPATDPEAVVLDVGAGVSRAAPIATWLTIAMEGAVAIAFVAPLPRRWRWLRDATLLAFVASTYVIAPVIGFGWLLLAMGVTQSGLAPKVRNALYIGAFGLIALTLLRPMVLFPLLERL